MKEYGSIIGQSDPTWFEFNIVDPKNRPVSYEYVEVEVEEPQQDGSMRSIQGARAGEDDHEPPPLLRREDDPRRGAQDGGAGHRR